MAFPRPSILAAFHDMVEFKRMKLLMQKSDACGGIRDQPAQTPRPASKPFLWPRLPICASNGLETFAISLLHGIFDAGLSW